MLGPRAADHIEGFRAALGELEPDDFFRFFNNSVDVDQSFVEGAWDFATSVSTPLAGLVAHPEQTTVLEIGYGGGRLLFSAARSFGRAIGVDVHDRTQLVADELRRRGVDNVELHVSDGTTLPVPDGSVGVVYSNLVFQHLQRLAVANAYVRETFRVLRPGGLAVNHVGRRVYGDLRQPNTRWRYWLDELVTAATMRSGYRELPDVRVNEINLLMRRGFAGSIFTSAGFDVIGVGPPGIPQRRSRQHRVVARKL